MRSAIKLIIKATGCDESQALRIEEEIDNMAMVDWSEDSSRKITSAAREAAIAVGLKL